MNVMRADISGSSATPSLNDRITHLEGFSVRVEDVQTVINEKMKAELQKSSAVIDEVNKQIATLTGAGGQLYKAVEQLVSQSFAAVDFKVNGVKNEITTIQQRIKSIEDSVAAGGVITPGVGGGHRNSKVLIEYIVIDNLQTMSSDKSKYKEWSDKLVNAVSHFRPYARTVLKLMRSLKDKEHDQSEVNMEVAKEPWSTNNSCDYDKFNEELYSVLVNQNRRRSKVEGHEGRRRKRPRGISYGESVVHCHVWSVISSQTYVNHESKATN
jgi:hypothetical protein